MRSPGFVVAPLIQALVLCQGVQTDGEESQVEMTLLSAPVANGQGTKHT